MALLSEVIRLRREELGLDQAELADRLGVGQQTVSRWETGVGLPRRDRLPALAAALDLDPGQLLRLAGYLPPGEEAAASAVFRAAYERAVEFRDDELVLLLDRLWTELRRRGGFRAPDVRHEPGRSTPGGPAPDAPAPGAPGEPTRGEPAPGEPAPGGPAAPRSGAPGRPAGFDDQAGNQSSGFTPPS